MVQTVNNQLCNKLYNRESKQTMEAAEVRRGTSFRCSQIQISLNK